MAGDDHDDTYDTFVAQPHATFVSGPAQAATAQRSAQATRAPRRAGPGRDVMLVSALANAGHDLRWSEQWARRVPWTSSFPPDTSHGGHATRELINVGRTPSHAQMLAHVRRAAQRAGAGGRVIFFVGHGYGDPRLGVGGGGSIVDLAPSGLGISTAVITAGRPIPIPSGGTMTHSAPELLGRQAIFLQMGQALHDAGVGRVVFLTCGIGANVPFMRLIASTWQVPVTGFADGVTTWEDPQSRIRLFLYSDGFTNGVFDRALVMANNRTCAIPRSWMEMPAFFASAP